MARLRCCKEEGATLFGSAASKHRPPRKIIRGAECAPPSCGGQAEGGATKAKETQEGEASVAPTKAHTDQGIAPLPPIATSVTLFMQPHQISRIPPTLKGLYANSLHSMDRPAEISRRQPVGARGAVRFGPRIEQGARGDGDGVDGAWRLHRHGHGADPRKEAPKAGVA